jgi:dTDP-4-dehydrorhamnose reductase
MYIINSAADKDSTIVRKTYNTINPVLNKDSEVDLFNHWTINVVRELAILSKSLDIPFIHISTVYVNKGVETTGNGWNNELINFNEYLNTLPKIKLNDDYIYGATKALAEWIAKIHNINTIIIRLPVLIDTKLKLLTDTSPSKVLLEMVNKALSDKKYH